MRKGLLQKVKRKHGYTLMEVLLVVGIVAIICAIAIPSIISISRSLSFKQKNDYAKAIFMAAQANLTEMKDDSELEPLQKAIDDAAFVGMKVARIPGEDPSTTEYRYVYSKGNTPGVYNTLLPVTSVEETLRDQYVLIEFNPITGNIYSVFYAEKDIEMETLYLENEGKLPRSEEDRKKLQLGYYDGTIVSSEKMDQADVSAVVRFLNGEEGIVQVNVPAQVNTQVIMDFNRMIKGLEVDLTVMGEQGGTYESSLHGKNDGKRFQTVIENGVNYVRVEFPLDSLIDSGSFANLATETDYSQDNTKKKHLTELTAADFNGKILPGDNVSISVDVTFTPSGNDPIINIESAAIAGVNPMFHSLTENPDKGKEGEKDYILAISNARNLQNLNALAPSIAEQVESVVFVENEKNEMRIDWGGLVEYYNANYGIGTNKQYSNASAEAPARALPYFVPIQNANLFGKASFVTAENGVITLSDTAADYAAIEGNGVKIYDVQINAANLTEKPDDDAYYAISDVDYDFTGLFSYVNTSVKDINIVNPKIIGADFTYANPATGALIGAAGVSTQVTGCGVYIDTADADFDRGLLNLSNFQGANNQYGISGHGAVGGLVGYARSDKAVDACYTHTYSVLSVDEVSDYITFSRCFAAVPVYGKMRDTTSGNYGYTNGVGGLIGNSQLTNFYSCYASGNVTAEKCSTMILSLSETASEALAYLGIDYDGAVSYGAGGFVGTSHGTCYTSCFSTGNVNGDAESAGSFVGLMCYDSSYSDHHTVFSSCYAVGSTVKSGTVYENFSGANALIAYSASLSNLGELDNADFYMLYAPNYLANNNEKLNHQSNYTFKDSYYLVQDGTNSEDSSAFPKTYDVFKLLHRFSDQSVDVATNELIRIEETTIFSVNFEGLGFFGRLEALWNARDDISALLSVILSENTAPSSLWTYLESGKVPFKFYFEFETQPPLEEQYLSLIQQAYSQTIWGTATTAQTHAYELGAAGLSYPFSMLVNMPYYGDWPVESSNVGIGYYEEYYNTETAEITTGYYFDQEKTATLQDGNTSINDGYAIFTTSADSVEITINNVTDTITPTATAIRLGTASDPDSISYHVAKLSDKLMEAAVKSQTTDPMLKTNDYYTTVTVKTLGETYTLYFNPNVALSQINPLDGSNTATKPIDEPEQVYIRTARQIAAVAENMEYFWDLNYVQQLNIDFDLYYEYQSYLKTNNDSFVAGGSALATKIKPIGNSTTSFTGTYTAAGESQLSISGHIPTADTNGNAGIFGVIGESATISNLIIIPDNEIKSGNEVSNVTEIKSDSNSVTLANAGLLAGTNNGTVENVDVLMNSGVEVKAAAAANFGLLVGSNTGTVAKSDVIIGEGAKTPSSMAGEVPQTEITVTGGDATSVGLLIGTNSAAGTLSECDAVAAVYSEAQTAETGNTESAKKPATINITGANVGLLAGKSEGGTITDCDVAPVFSTTDTAAAPYYEAQLTVNATANMFGGLVGNMGNTNVGVRNYNSGSDNPCEINLYQVNATNAFGGLAGTAASGTITNVEVVFGDRKTNASIFAENVSAGMIAMATSVSVSDSTVDLIGIINSKRLATGVFGSVDYVEENNVPATTQGNSKIANVRFTFAEDDLVDIMSSETAGKDSSNAKNAVLKYMIKSGEVAAGFVGSTNGTIENCYVSGNGTIYGLKYSAGFVNGVFAGVINNCAVTVAPNDANMDTSKFHNENLVIGQDQSATQDTFSEISAGFAVANAGTISQSMALGSVHCATGETSQMSGFVMENTGTIQTSICNVNMALGNVFADTNSGLVENCYGWSSGGRGDEVIAKEGSTPYVSSYFAVMSPEEDEPAVVLYDADGVLSETVTDYIALLSDEAMTALMGFDDNDRPQTNSPWLQDSSTMLNTYAYTMTGYYPYPMLRHHYGDWAEPFGVLYYEKYSDENWGIRVLDLNHGKEVENTLCPATEGVTVDLSGYAIYYRNTLQYSPIANVDVESIVDGHKLYELVNAFDTIGEKQFGLYSIKADGVHQLSKANTTQTIVYFDTRFADTFNVTNTKDTPYAIRTEDQMKAAIAANPATEENADVLYFVVDRDMIITDQNVSSNLPGYIMVSDSVHITWPENTTQVGTTGESNGDSTEEP